MEVMGLMLGQFVDDYTVNCIDVFAMPQSGTGVSVEAVDPVFQTKMLDMLKQTGRPEVRKRLLRLGLFSKIWWFGERADLGGSDLSSVLAVHFSLSDRICREIRRKQAGGTLFRVLHAWGVPAAEAYGRCCFHATPRAMCHLWLW